MIRFCSIVAAVLTIMLASVALAQSSNRGPGPDRLALGTVRVGATVEASFGLSDVAKDPKKVVFTVEAPDFVKVLDKSVFPGDVDLVDDELIKGVHAVVVIAIDTNKPGTFEGEIKVTLGGHAAKVPVSVVVKSADAAAIRILVAESPFHAYSTSDGGTFKAWTDLVTDAKWNVDYLSVTRGKPVMRDLDLTRYGTVLLPGDALVSATEQDINGLRAFVEKGGRLVIAANHFFGRSVEKANTILDGYGLKMVDAEAPLSANAVTVDDASFGPELVKAGIKSARFFRASPAVIADAKRAKVLVKAAWVGGTDDGFVAIASAGKGEVVALGQSLWWHWISTDGAKGTDNAKLLRFLLTPGAGR